MLCLGTLTRRRVGNCCGHVLRLSLLIRRGTGNPRAIPRTERWWGDSTPPDYFTNVDLGRTRASGAWDVSGHYVLNASVRAA